MLMYMSQVHYHLMFLYCLATSSCIAESKFIFSSIDLLQSFFNKVLASLYFKVFLSALQQCFCNIYFSFVMTFNALCATVTGISLQYSFLPLCTHPTSVTGGPSVYTRDMVWYFTQVQNHIVITIKCSS